MGARHAEFGLGCWLCVSPFVFGHADAPWFDLWVGLGVMLLALLCYAPALHRAHLGQLVLATLLVATGWWTQRHEPAPAAENHLVVGLLLAMTALVPSRAGRPPRSWTSERSEGVGEEPSR